MVLKLYTGKRWGLVDLVLTEKQVPYERVMVDMANRQHKTPEFLAMHPFGQVPVIDDDGFILCETRAICRYIAEKYADQGTPLLPTDLKGKALFEQAASFEFANFLPQVMKALVLYFSGDVEAKPDLLKDAVSAVAEKLAVYDIILGKQKFLAGNELTLADLFHLYYAPYFADNGVDVMTSSGPNVARWWNELIQRPTWVTGSN
ncbi:glutathione S-transferase-like protein [Mycena rebaudengoi]|nr:glutathione S-transferase-like protein [Mycena rebaudengoi]